MGFVKDIAKTGALGLAGALGAQLFGGKKKKPPTSTPVPTMISSTSRPTSMIGSTRGGY